MGHRQDGKLEPCSCVSLPRDSGLGKARCASDHTSEPPPHPHSVSVLLMVICCWMRTRHHGLREEFTTVSPGYFSRYVSSQYALFYRKVDDLREKAMAPHSCTLA